MGLRKQAKTHFFYKTLFILQEYILPVQVSRQVPFSEHPIKRRKTYDVICAPVTGLAACDVFAVILERIYTSVLQVAVIHGDRKLPINTTNEEEEEEEWEKENLPCVWTS